MIEPNTALAQAKDCAARALSVIDQAAAIRVASSGDYETASEFLGGVIKPTLAQIEATFRPITRAQDAAKAATLAERAKLEQPLLAAEKTIKAAMIQYAIAQEEIAKAAAAKALAEQEREQRRLEAERDALADALEADGNTETAVALLEMPVAAPMPTFAPVEQPRAKGAGLRVNYAYTITDDSKIPRAFLLPNDKAIGALVRTLGHDAERQIPGIAVTETKTLSQRVR